MLIPDLASDGNLDAEPAAIAAASLEGATASLRPVPPPRPEGEARPAPRSGPALTRAEDGCLDLVGMLGRWIMESLLLRPPAVCLPDGCCGS